MDIYTSAKRLRQLESSIRLLHQELETLLREGLMRQAEEEDM